MAAGQAAVWLTIYLAFIPGPFLFTELMGLLLGFWELSLWVSEDLLRAAGKMILWALGVFWVCICPYQSSEKLEESFLPLSSSLPPSLPASQCHMLLHRVCSPHPHLPEKSWDVGEDFRMLWVSWGEAWGRSKELSFSWGGCFFANRGVWRSLPHLQELS